MTVVDNNVLSALAKIERLDLIDGTFNDVSTTPGVIEELDTARLEGYRFVERIDDIRGMEGWLDVVIPTEEERTLAENIRDHSLSFVDAQCIAIANLRSEKLLTDD